MININKLILKKYSISVISIEMVILIILVLYIIIEFVAAAINKDVILSDEKLE